MGGSSTKIVYQISPEQQKRLASLKGANDDLQKKLKAGKEHAVTLEKKLAKITTIAEASDRQFKKFQADLNDPAQLRQNEERLFNNFLEQVRKMDLASTSKDRLQHSVGDVTVVVAGKVSAGKSTFVNALFQEHKASTGLGRVTTELKEVGTLKGLPRTGYNCQLKLRIYDAPGDDREFDYLAIETLRVIAAIDVIIILYDNTPEYCSQFVRLAMAMGKQCIFLRNKCDNSSSEDVGSWKRYRTQDAQEIGKMGILDPLVFGISARNVVAANHEAKRIAEEAGQPGKNLPNTFDMYEWSKFRSTLEDVGYRLIKGSLSAEGGSYGAQDVDIAMSSGVEANNVRRMSTVLNKKLLNDLKAGIAMPKQDDVKHAQDQTRDELFKEISALADTLIKAANTGVSTTCIEVVTSLEAKVKGLK